MLTKNELVSSKELMEYFGISRTSVYRLTKKNILNPIIDGNKHFYKVKDVMSFLDKKPVFNEKIAKLNGYISKYEIMERLNITFYRFSTDILEKLEPAEDKPYTYFTRTSYEKFLKLNPNYASVDHEYEAKLLITLKEMMRTLNLNKYDLNKLQESGLLVANWDKEKQQYVYTKKGLEVFLDNHPFYNRKLDLEGIDRDNKKIIVKLIQSFENQNITLNNVQTPSITKISPKDIIERLDIKDTELLNQWEEENILVPSTDDKGNKYYTEKEYQKFLLSEPDYLGEHPLLILNGAQQAIVFDLVNFIKENNH